jgi:hypothetical protein
MAETIGDLEVKLRADITKLESDLAKAEGRANTAGKRIARNMQGAFKGLGAIRVKLGLLAFGLAQIAALGGMKKLIDGSLAAADAIGKTSDKLGISNSALQEFQYAAVQSGVKVETLNMGLQRFGRRAAEAAAGTGEARSALKQLGIQLTDTNGSLRSTENLFMDSMKALSDIESPLERVRLGFKLFDSEGVALVNLAGNIGELRNEAQAMGLVLDDEVIAKSSETKDTLSALAKVTSAQLTPALVDLGGGALVAVGEQLSAAAFWANKLYRAFADTADLGLSNAILRQGEATKELAQAEEDLARRKKEVLAIAGNEEFDAMLIVHRRTIKERKQELLDLKKHIEEKKKARADAAKQISGGDAPVNVAAEKKAADLRRKIAAKAIEDLRKMRATEREDIWHEANKKMQILQEASAGELEALGGLRVAKAAIREKMRLDIKEINDREALEVKEARNRALKLEGRQADKIKRINAGVLQDFQEATMSETVLLGIELERQLAAHKKLLNDKEISEKQYEENIILLKKTTEAKIAALQADADGAMESAMESALERRNKAFEESFGFIRDGFTDAMTDMLITGEITFKELAQSFLREFVNRAIGSLAGTAFDSLGALFGGAAKPDLAINTTGGNPFSGMAANGGPIGGPTLVGERGPELFIPHTSGFVATNQSLGKMSGGGGNDVTVTVVNNTGQEATTTERDGPNGTRSIEVMVGKAISKNIARGGDVDQAIRNSYGVNRVGRHGI